MQNGIRQIFTKDADFNLISTESLHLEELVQHVSIRVDEGASSENFLTAIGTQRNVEGDQSQEAANAAEKSISINKPFLYFVRDIIDDIVFVAGKYMSPPELPKLLEEEL